MPFLPPEIISRIGDYADLPTIQACRLANKSFEAAIRISFLRYMERLVVDVHNNCASNESERAVSRAKNPTIAEQVKELILCCEKVEAADRTGDRPENAKAVLKAMPSIIRNIPNCTWVQISFPSYDYQDFGRFGAPALARLLAASSKYRRSIEELLVDGGDLDSLDWSVGRKICNAFRTIKPKHLDCVRSLKSLALPIIGVPNADEGSVEVPMAILEEASETLENLELSISGVGPAVEMFFHELKRGPLLTFPRLKTLSLRVRISGLLPLIPFIKKHIPTITHLSLAVHYSGRADAQDLIFQNEMKPFAVMLETLGVHLEEFSLDVILEPEQTSVQEKWSKKDAEGLVPSVEAWMLAIPTDVDEEIWQDGSFDGGEIIEDYDESEEDDEDDEEEYTEEYGDESEEDEEGVNGERVAESSG